MAGALTAGMTKMMFALMFVPALTTACMLEAPEPEVRAESEAQTATLGKKEIINDGLTSCDGGNGGCFKALENDAKNCSNTTGDEQKALKCWCTHCDNGNFCDSYDDHQTNDDKCTLKPKTEAETESLEAAATSIEEGDIVIAAAGGAGQMDHYQTCVVASVQPQVSCKAGLVCVADPSGPPFGTCLLPGEPNPKFPAPTTEEVSLLP